MHATAHARPVFGHALLTCVLLGLGHIVHASPLEPSLQEPPAEPISSAPQVLHSPWPPSEPVLVPCHANVTTTVLFPVPPEAPDGAGFTQDPATISGAYRVSWRAGDAHLSVAPLEDATSRNLNVPCEGRVVVLVFQPVQDPAQACALLHFQNDALTEPGMVSEPLVRRSERRTAPAYQSVGPARVLGMLDRMKLLHASGGGAQTEALLLAMRGVSWSHLGRTSTCGPLRIEPLLCLRDERLDLLGFSCVLVNTGPKPVRLEPASFAARAGAGFHRAATADAPSLLGPGDAAPAFFVVHGTSEGSPGHLAAHNDWLITLEVLGEAPTAP